MSFPLTQWVEAMQRWDKDRLEVRESSSRGDGASLESCEERGAGTPLVMGDALCQFYCKIFYLNNYIHYMWRKASHNSLNCV